MVNKEDVAEEEIPVANGKYVIQYIEQDGTPSTKFKATFMCEYLYDDNGVLLSHNIFNNPHLGEDIDNSKDSEEIKTKRITLHLSEDTINKLNELANKENKTKSEFITQLINNCNGG